MITEPVPGPSAPQSPAAIHPGASPYWPHHLVDLFLRPTKFFTDQLALDRAAYAVIAAWALGLSTVLGRFDSAILRAQAGNDLAFFETFASLLGSWPLFWGVVILLGGVVGTLHWTIGGWWCRVRLRWCGDEWPGDYLPRLLVIYSSFIFAGPWVIALVGQTILYPSYLAASLAPLDPTVVLLPLPFWSLFTTYKGAVALFPIRRWPARLWFIVLPGILYVAAIGTAAIFLPLR